MITYKNNEKVTHKRQNTIIHTGLVLGLNVLITQTVVAESIPVKTQDTSFVHDYISDVSQDYTNFYDKETLSSLGIAFVGGAAMANIHVKDNQTIDEHINTWYQDTVHSSGTDSFADFTRPVGEWTYLLPLSVAAASTEYFFGDSEIGKWGNTASRAYAVGVPAMLVAQRLTGASRPSERVNTSGFIGSTWKPMEDENGVSGHSFVGAVAFLSLAANHEDSPWIKYPAYVASTAGALSRINDEKHYLSQALLGWYFAYESVKAVSDTNKDKKQSVFTPVVTDSSIGFKYVTKW